MTVLMYWLAGMGVLLLAKDVLIFTRAYRANRRMAEQVREFFQSLPPGLTDTQVATEWIQFLGLSPESIIKVSVSPRDFTDRDWDELEKRLST